MMRDDLLVLAARIANIPFRLFRQRAAEPPRKALILKPCCLSQVMLATPLLAALSDAYPEAQIDWAVSKWARPAIAANPRVAEIIDTGRVGLPDATRSDVAAFVELLKREQYDTCFVPSRSSLLAYIAWRAGIPQRIGLNYGGRGFAYTVSVPAPEGEPEAEVYLGLAHALGIEDKPWMEFHPADADRAKITRLLVDRIDWLGDRPLVLMHPGGGENPRHEQPAKRWPAERFALLGNHLVREHDACVLVLGSADHRELARAVDGLMPTKVENLAGELSLSEVGALCEVADLYVGNDAGPTQVAAAVGCPTLAIFGPSDPRVSAPYARPERVAVVSGGRVPAWSFSWDERLPAAEVAAAADQLLEMTRRKSSSKTIERDVNDVDSRSDL